MAKFYNQLRSLKGTAVGTILAWSGDIGNIPAGWIRCDGSILSSADYPELFEVIGYQYGGEGLSFTIPNLLNKAIVDYHPSHSNIPGLGLNTTNDSEFISRIGTNTANSTAGRTSNIDLYVNLTQINNVQGKITQVGINQVGYSEEVTILPRVLSDRHMASHSHGNVVNSVGNLIGYVERCQTDNDTNCESTFGEPDCSDECGVLQYYPTEANGNVEWSSYVRPIGITGGGGTYGLNIIGGSPSSADTAQLAPVNTPTKNYILPEDDALIPGANANGNIGYPVHLNHPGVNYSGSPIGGGAGSQTQNFTFVGHDHLPIPFSITQGNVRTPNSITVSNISTANMTPANSVTQGIASIRMENINTPSLNIIHIIRAY